MGCFDSVKVRCIDCGGEIEFQSKVGECILADYDLDHVPVGIAKDINGTTEHCRSCGRPYEIYADGLPDTVRMKLR